MTQADVMAAAEGVAPESQDAAPEVAPDAMRPPMRTR